MACQIQLLISLQFSVRVETHPPDLWEWCREREGCRWCLQWWLVPETVADDVSLPPPSWLAVVCGSPSHLGHSCSPHSASQVPPASGFLSLPFGDSFSESSEHPSSPGPESHAALFRSSISRCLRTAFSWPNDCLVVWQSSFSWVSTWASVATSFLSSAVILSWSLCSGEKFPALRQSHTSLQSQTCAHDGRIECSRGRWDDCSQNKKSSLARSTPGSYVADLLSGSTVHTPPPLSPPPSPVSGIYTSLSSPLVLF